LVLIFVDIALQFAPLFGDSRRHRSLRKLRLLLCAHDAPTRDSQPLQFVLRVSRSKIK
jgi:hypothetical protein